MSHAGQDKALDRAIDDVIEAGRILSAKGWLPATSGNLSARIDTDRMAITASGYDKGRLERGQILIQPLDGPPLPGSSAETALHLAAYRRAPQIGAVLHVHSKSATLISRLALAQGRDRVIIEGYELQKAFAGVKTHAQRLEIAVFPNTQDIDALSARVEAVIDGFAPVPGYLIGGHGLYAWGANRADAIRHVEAFEFLLSCELALAGVAL